MTVRYSQYSPYAKTEQTFYLGYNLPSVLYPADSDTQYEIPNQYDEQPWRLAKELYGNERLYYIFALLNTNILFDPIYDFKSGTIISVPTLQRVQNWLNGTRTIL